MYFPKSQITPNLYTNGSEFFLNGESYTGYYFKTSKGKYFTGKNTSDLPNTQIFKITNLSFDLTPANGNGNFIQFADNYDGYTFNTQLQHPENNFIYNSLNPQKQYITLPYYNPVLPTQQDYQNEEFQRYFCKKTNEIQYIEINLDQFTKLKAQDPQILYQLYQPFTISWILIGNKDQVAKTNKNIVELASFRQKLPRFGDYLKFDYLKYYNQSGSTNVLANRNPRTNSISRDASPTGSFYRDNPLSQ